MNRPPIVPAILGIVFAALLWAATDGLAAEEGSRTWLETWRKNNPQWRALHLIGPQPQRLDVTKELITTGSEGTRPMMTLDMSGTKAALNNNLPESILTWRLSLWHPPQYARGRSC
jgi:hypothetical protein